MKPEVPNEIPGLRKATRVKFQTIQDYIPSMKGSEYAVTVAHLENHGTLQLDAHMVFMQNYAI